MRISTHNDKDSMISLKKSVLQINSSLASQKIRMILIIIIIIIIIIISIINSFINIIIIVMIVIIDSHICHIQCWQQICQEN